jgi:hypothetical protein
MRGGAEPGLGGEEEKPCETDARRARGDRTIGCERVFGVSVKGKDFGQDIRGEKTLSRRVLSLGPLQDRLFNVIFPRG